MTRMELRSRIGADGVLTVTVPMGVTEANREVIVTVEAVEPSLRSPVDRETWQRIVEETSGSIQDPTFCRHEQGDYEQREAWE
ncbi:MAG: hypothetical protein HY718_12710 [Planctomycetes bacterium]|nr:hypothetical protein [Planctomycetota bacterium]